MGKMIGEVSSGFVAIFFQHVIRLWGGGWGRGTFMNCSRTGAGLISGLCLSSLDGCNCVCVCVALGVQEEESKPRQ